MRRFLHWLLGLGALAAALVIAWSVYFPRAILHARITAVVETPEGPRSGASVVQLGYATEPPIGDRSGVVMGLGAGEAVAVDLGPRGTLYMLLSARGRDGRPTASPSHALLLIDVFRSALGEDADHRNKDLVRRLQVLRGSAGVPKGKVPFLVRFRDERDPKTVEAVDPDNLAAAFGEGVRLGSVTIEITDDPVTRGIEKRVGWLGDGQTLNRVWKSLSDAQHGILSTANWRSGE